jgi:hypothetical protein
LESIQASQLVVGLPSLGNPVLLLLALSAGFYASYIWLAVATQRHLFGDGSWFLIKMLSENHVAIWNVAGWHDFFAGRYGAFAYQEYPTLLASRLGIRDLRELSVIYGLTLFAFKPLGLLLCYHFARDKRYLFFPIITLCAITINSEGYLVTETHLMSALFWAALFGLLFCPRLKGWDLVAMVVVSAPLLLCYESMAVYGVILIGGCVYRAIAVSESNADQWLTVAFGLWYAMGTLFGVLALAFPRDPTQLGAFLASVLFVFRNDHIGARVSCVVMLLCVLLILIPNRPKWISNSIAALSIACSVAIPAYILRHPGRTSLDNHILARTMNASMPLGVAAFFLATHLGWIRIDVEKYKRLFVMAAVLGICQSSWHLIATSQWAQMLTLLRGEIRTQSGAVPFEGSLLSQWTVDGAPVRNLHADWPLLPLSVVFAEHGNVRTVLLPPIGKFQPFNPFSPDTLPDLQRFGVNYQPYIATLSSEPSEYRPGEWVSLNARTDLAGVREMGEWWEPESWGTWSGREAGLSFRLGPGGNSELVLEALAGAFVNEKNPHLEVQVFVNDIAVGNLEFNYSSSREIYHLYQIPVPEQALSKANPAVVWFKVKGARSPADLGMSGDPRTLGLALVRVRFVTR